MKYTTSPMQPVTERGYSGRQESIYLGLAPTPLGVCSWYLILALDLSPTAMMAVLPVLYTGAVAVAIKRSSSWGTRGEQLGSCIVAYGLLIFSALLFLMFILIFRASLGS